MVGGHNHESRFFGHKTVRVRNNDLVGIQPHFIGYSIEPAALLEECDPVQHHVNRLFHTIICDVEVQ